MPPAGLPARLRSGGVRKPSWWPTQPCGRRARRTTPLGSAGMRPFSVSTWRGENSSCCTLCPRRPYPPFPACPPRAFSTRPACHAMHNTRRSARTPGECSALVVQRERVVCALQPVSQAMSARRGHWAGLQQVARRGKGPARRQTS